MGTLNVPERLGNIKLFDGPGTPNAFASFLFIV